MIANKRVRLYNNRKATNQQPRTTTKNQKAPATTRSGVGLSSDASAAQHPARTLYEVLSRGAGTIGARIDVRAVPDVGDRPAVSEVPTSARH
jgi:hypothetical protein